MVLDGFVEEDPDRGRGNECHGERDHRASTLLAAADDAFCHGDDTAAIDAEHGKDRADLYGDRERVGGVLDALRIDAAALADVEDSLGDEQVTGRADRQELGDALHRAEDDGLARRERVGDRCLGTTARTLRGCAGPMGRTEHHDCDDGEEQCSRPDLPLRHASATSFRSADVWLWRSPRTVRHNPTPTIQTTPM